MNKKIRRLEKKLRRAYFLKHFKPKLVVSYLRCFVLLNLAITLPLIVNLRNLKVLYAIPVIAFISLFAVERRIIILFNLTKKSKSRYARYQNEMAQGVLDLYFERRISRNVYTGYFVSAQKDLCDVNLNEYVRRTEKEINRRKEFVRNRLTANNAN